MIFTYYLQKIRQFHGNIQIFANTLQKICQIGLIFCRQRNLQRILQWFKHSSSKHLEQIYSRLFSKKIQKYYCKNIARDALKLQNPEGKPSNIRAILYYSKRYFVLQYLIRSEYLNSTYISTRSTFTPL